MSPQIFPPPTPSIITTDPRHSGSYYRTTTSVHIRVERGWVDTSGLCDHPCFHSHFPDCRHFHCYIRLVAFPWYFRSSVSYPDLPLLRWTWWMNYCLYPSCWTLGLGKYPSYKTMRYLLPQEEVTGKRTVWSVLTFPVNSTACRYAIWVRTPGSCEVRGRVSITGGSEMGVVGEVVLVDCMFCRSWRRRPLAVARLLGKCLGTRAEVRPGHVVKHQRWWRRSRLTRRDWRPINGGAVKCQTWWKVRVRC